MCMYECTRAYLCGALAHVCVMHLQIWVLCLMLFVIPSNLGLDSSFK